LTKTLLAVEDSKTMRKVLGITFASDEFETVLVDNAQEGLAKLDQLRPDLALIDVTLSDINGYDLCRRLKSRNPGLPVMILSSRQQPYDPVRGADAGADDFIDKPFDTQQIRDKVQKLVSKNGAAVARPAAAGSAMAGSAMAGAATAGAAPAYQPSRTPAPVAPPVARVQPASPARPAERRAEPARSVSASLRAVTGGAAQSDAASPAGALVNGALMERLQGLDLSSEQVNAVLAISRDVIEKVVWEVVPVLAETLIKEEIARLTRE
jgi:CheY-like chemotaxis protein